MKLSRSSRVVFDFDQRQDFLRFQSKFKTASSPLCGSGESTEKTNKQRSWPSGKVCDLEKVLISGQTKQRSHGSDACVFCDTDRDNPFGLAQKFLGELYEDRFVIGGHGARHFIRCLAASQEAVLWHGLA